MAEKLSIDLAKSIMEGLVDRDVHDTLDNVSMKALLATIIKDGLIKALRWCPIFTEEEYIKSSSSSLATAHHIAILDNRLPEFMYCDREQRYLFLKKATQIYDEMRLDLLRRIGQFDETHYTEKYCEYVNEYVLNHDRLTAEEKTYIGDIIIAGINIDDNYGKLFLFDLGRKGISHERVTELIKDSLTDPEFDYFANKYHEELCSLYPETDPDDLKETASIMSEIYIKAMGAVTMDVVESRNAL